MSDLAQVLADAREEAAVLRANRAAFSPDRVEDILKRIADAAEDYLVFVPESEAMLKSGRARAWLRARYAAWEADGHAKKLGGVRHYRRVILPRCAPRSPRCSAAGAPGARSARSISTASSTPPETANARRSRGGRSIRGCGAMVCATPEIYPPLSTRATRCRGRS